jgi:protein-tyrosine phosphatase
VAQRLTGSLVTAGDLILTAETRHREAIVRADPLSFRRTFTIREFARLAAPLAPLAVTPTEADLRARVYEVSAQRGWAPPPAKGADEIGDPFGASVEIARGIAAEIAAAVDVVVATLGGRGTR